MALQVWMPLNGTLKNQGLSAVAIRNSGATVDSSGKIGSCYSFNGSDSYIALNSTKLNAIFKGGTNPFSVSFWVYHADSTRAILFGDFSLTGSIGFNIELTSGHLVRFYWSANPDKTFLESSVGLNTWVHICITYDGSKLLIYKNGSLLSDSFNGELVARSKTSGDFYLGRDSRTGTTALNGKLNDFRVYDHCLSPKEVKEISKGLVLHYKLEGNSLPKGLEFYDYIQTDGSQYIDTNYNLNVGDIFTFTYSDVFNGSTKLTGSSENKGYGQGTSGDSSHNYSGGGRIHGGKIAMWINGNDVLSSIDPNNSTGKYTETLEINNNNVVAKLQDSVGTVYINNTISTSVYNSGNLYFFKDSALGYPYPGVKKFYGSTIYRNGSLRRNFIPCVYNGEIGIWDSVEGKFYGNNGSGTFTLGNKVSLVSLADDCSGYGNNGYVIGDIFTSNDTPRYSNCGVFSGQSRITSSNINLNGMTPLTISCWLKLTARQNYEPVFWVGDGSTSHGIALHGGYANRIEGGNGVDPKFDKSYSSDIQLDTWKYVVVKWDGSNVTSYVDCVEKTSIPFTAGFGSTLVRLYLGYFWGGYYTGNISDFRLYTTVLSDDDIKELYDTSEFIYNDGTLAAYEFDEDGDTTEMLKNGIVKSSDYEEGYDVAAIYSNNIQTKQLIEI